MPSMRWRNGDRGFHTAHQPSLVGTGPGRHDPQFPFRILGFHSDNGSEFINAIVSGLLNKLLIGKPKAGPPQQ